jgi:hypothetical protein
MAQHTPQHQGGSQLVRLILVRVSQTLINSREAQKINQN